MSMKELLTQTLVFELEHLATFIEEEEHMEPEDIMSQVVELDTEWIKPVNCTLEINTNGLRIYVKGNNEVLEDTTWDKVRDQAVISCFDTNYERNVLLIFRVIKDKNLKDGLPCELFVFDAKNESSAKNVIDEIINLQQNQALHYLTENLSDFRGTSRVKAIPLVASRPDQLVYTAQKLKALSMDAYGRNFYMLNRCLDEIESFDKRLTESLGIQSSKENLCTEKTQHPNFEEAVDVLRKTKFALNKNNEIKTQVPNLYNKVLVFLIRFLKRTDTQAKENISLGYGSNLLPDIIEPLLYESTITALMERLSPKMKTFWLELGPSWNTPSEKWPNHLELYMPTFKTNGLTIHTDNDDKPQIFYRNDKAQFKSEPLTASSLTLVSNENPYIVDKKPSTTVQAYSTRVPTASEEFINEVRSRNGRLCSLNRHHISSKTKELSGIRDEILELIDTSNTEWWTVRNQLGEVGILPKNKLTILHSNKNATREVIEGEEEKSSIGDSSSYVCSIKVNKNTDENLKKSVIRKKKRNEKHGFLRGHSELPLMDNKRIFITNKSIGYPTYFCFTPTPTVPQVATSNNSMIFVPVFPSGQLKTPKRTRNARVQTKLLLERSTLEPNISPRPFRHSLEYGIPYKPTMVLETNERLSYT